MTERPSLGTLCAALCKITGVAPPPQAAEADSRLLNYADTAFNGETADRLFMYNPDAIAEWLFEKYPAFFIEATARTELQLPYETVMPSVTPVCFGTMYTGVQPAVHGIRKYEKPVLKIETLFDQLIPMYLGIAPSTCGMLGRCSMQVVVEGDGSIYPCDFYVLDKYYCGNIHDLSLKDILQSDQVKAFLTEKQEISPLCLNCAFYKMCYGNCKRMNVCMKDETYCGYQAFLKYSQERMYQIARQMKKL